MVSAGQAFGVLLVENGPTSAQLTSADLNLVAGIAGTVSITIAYARVHARLLDQQLIERDMMLARKVQQRFLPARPPETNGYGFAVHYEPAMAVGGDFYDFLSLAGGRVGVAVGDVCGKGVGAAFYAAKLGSELRYESVGQSEPAAILARVNNSLAAWSEDGMFVTLVLAVLEPASGRLTVASAGHPFPMLRTRTASCATWTAGPVRRSALRPTCVSSRRSTRSDPVRWSSSTRTVSTTPSTPRTTCSARSG